MIQEKRMKLEDVPELIQQIQLRLPEKAAARTAVLSKSWLHAWSTIPTLRFHVSNEQKHLKIAYIDRTLIRYLHDNIPIEKLDLSIQVQKGGEWVSPAEKWIRSVSTNTCLKELSVTFGFWDASLNLPNEIMSSENLTKLRVSVCWEVPLRLLAKIYLRPDSADLKTIKVKSLPYLEELDIATYGPDFTSVEINHVPNLRVFSCDIYDGPRCMCMVPSPFKTHSISLGSSLTQLSLGGQGLVTDDESLNMIESGLFPFLESLTLDLICWRLASFRFTCPASSPIKRFFLTSCPNTVTEIQIYVVDLIFFSNIASKITTTSFPISKTLEEMKLQVSPRMGGYSASCLVKLRETLELSNKCYLDLCTHVPPLHVDFDLDDLKTRLEFLRFPPATNVQTLTFETCKDECKWNNSEFFDAFFEICRPKQVFANKDAFFQNNNHFCKLIVRTRNYDILVLVIL
ncbi:hypothetical protein LXL04_026224 [Taraxacum kok-saghyz]